MDVFAGSALIRFIPALLICKETLSCVLLESINPRNTAAVENVILPLFPKYNPALPISIPSPA